MLFPFTKSNLSQSHSTRYNAQCVTRQSHLPLFFLPSPNVLLSISFARPRDTIRYTRCPFLFPLVALKLPACPTSSGPLKQCACSSTRCVALTHLRVIIRACAEGKSDVSASAKDRIFWHAQCGGFSLGGRFSGKQVHARSQTGNGCLLLLLA